MSTTPRKIGFSTILNSIKKSPVLFAIGFIFTLVSLIVYFSLSVAFKSLQPNVPSINYDQIDSQGVAKTAKVTNLEVQRDMLISGVRPVVVFYEYTDNGKKINSSYLTTSAEKANALKIGDEINIKTYKGSSVIPGMEHYAFPFHHFKKIPLLFLALGLLFLLYSLYQISKETSLLKHGKLSKGEIVSLTPKTSTRGSNFGLGAYVSYKYETSSGKSNTGTSFTDDLSILQEKKAGDPISIFVSPNNEDNSCIVPKKEAERNDWNISFL